MKRRNFLSFLGVGSATAVVAGCATTATVAAYAAVKSTDEDVIDKIDQQNPFKVTFTAKYGEVEPPAPVFGAGGDESCFKNFCVGNINQPKFVKGTEYDVSIQAAVGPDGNVYIKSNGKWKKVLTEE